MIFYNGWAFSDPTPVWLWNPLAVSGIYAIQAMEGESAPRPIYFGRTEDFSGCRSVSAHRAFRSWARAAGGELKLWISFHRETDALRRVAKEQALIRAYAPLCNAGGQQSISPTTA